MPHQLLALANFGMYEYEKKNYKIKYFSEFAVIAVNKIHGKRGSRCYWPWIVTTGMLNLLDVAASIIYIVDITKSLVSYQYD